MVSALCRAYRELCVARELITSRGLVGIRPSQPLLLFIQVESVDQEAKGLSHLRLHGVKLSGFGLNVNWAVLGRHLQR